MRKKHFLEQLLISFVSIYEWIDALSEYVALSLHLLLMANLYQEVPQGMRCLLHSLQPGSVWCEALCECLGVISITALKALLHLLREGAAA